ncbi:helix-turn-helix domain-containing protein [Mesorhizobium sp.]|uniref:helix-turn-helix domain-containing protein n=1 Tax=Mesorhizobium sp. TaxID=1871066 RepID=UPI0025CDEED9|nr:helix-turn-helix domain-containing protein [Mesorhizobium sp.]
MAGRQRVIDEDQKLELLQRMEAGETVSGLADEVGISRQRLYEWRDHLRLHGNLKSRRRGRPARSAWRQPRELLPSLAGFGPASGRDRFERSHSEADFALRQAGRHLIDDLEDPVSPALLRRRSPSKCRKASRKKIEIKLLLPDFLLHLPDAAPGLGQCLFLRRRHIDSALQLQVPDLVAQSRWRRQPAIVRKPGNSTFRRSREWYRSKIEAGLIADGGNYRGR